jgi:general secretion pathway protein J
MPGDLGGRSSLAPADRGFTLLEVLVTLVVLGCLLLAIGQGVRFGLAAARVQARMGDSAQELEPVRRSLRHLIAAIDPGTEDSGAPIAAGPHELSVISVLPITTGPGLSAEATLLVDQQHRLVLRWRPYLHATRAGTVPVTESELTSGVERLDLAYRGSAGGWVDRWREQSLPSLVRIRLEFAPGDPRRWSDVVVAPLLDRY